MVAHIAAGGTTDFAPGVLQNEPAAYTDAGRANLEKRELFLKRPLLVGLSCDLPAPGDCLVFDDAGPSIIVVRGSDGIARGFLNMCTHRASRLLGNDGDGICERRTRFSCPFHGWTFDLQGALAGIPGRAGFEGLDVAARSLISVPVTEWHGMIFVRPTAESEPVDVAVHLDAFAVELMQLQLEQAVPIRRSRLSAPCNWKIALDTYCEGYHFGILHASTIGVTHYSNVAVFDDFGPHWRINFPDKAIKALVSLPDSQWPDVEYGGIHFIFPNTVLVVGASGPERTFVRMFRLFPGETAGEMSCRIAVYEVGETRDRLAAQNEFTQDDSESEVTQEDYRVAVDGYRNLLNAPAGFTVVYGRNEPALQSFHRHVAEAIGIVTPL